MLDLDNINSSSVVEDNQIISSQPPISIAKDIFKHRHIGIDSNSQQLMLKQLGYNNLDTLINTAVPKSIRLQNPLKLPSPLTETQALATLKAIAQENQVYNSYIGMGYYNCITPAVIQRNILENPNWYTAYTPYQPEIAQGRLEALLNFQTMIISLTGLEIANASLLDEATAAAEAMTMSYAVTKHKSHTFFIDINCHPQTIEVIKTRAKYLEIELIIDNPQTFDFNTPIFGALFQYPASDGTIYDYQEIINQIHQQKGIVTLAADLLSLALLKSPGELNADIAVGNTQRFGVPLGYGGPHAAYFATKDDYKRQVPGRIIGVSKDVHGQPALRLALQTREQHIRRDKATSNICTAQVLLAVIASTYAVYHGEEGIKNIALRVNQLTKILAKGLENLGYKIKSNNFFDTITIEINDPHIVRKKAQSNLINFRYFKNAIAISIDETTTIDDIKTIWSIFGQNELNINDLTIDNLGIPSPLKRQSRYLTESVFNQYHSETELLRYLHRLETKDLSLTTSMIALGSCTMKLNATAEMLPVTWAEFNNIHPFAPLSQTKGYQTLFSQLETWLGEITGFAGISLQPNAGSQGEYTGLQVIRKYHDSRGDLNRDICLIPESAHGTNPASSVMCGLKVIPVKCDTQGDIDMEDLKAKAEKYQQNLAALMITYPSTHGVFEEGIKDICDIIHGFGGQVYLDGANMNAQVGLCRPGDFGADVCHLNLHKTFCIPHGGGGPGVGPIGVASHLVPFLPSTSLSQSPLSNGGNIEEDTSLPRTLGNDAPLPPTLGGNTTNNSPQNWGFRGDSIGMISAAPWGSASILPISWMYIAMMGSEGLTDATKIAILNANYIAHRLAPHYPILFTGKSGLVAHECIIDLRPLRKTAHIEVEDVAKRLMDYGFHAPTMSWPVGGTMMIEPTESESLPELDRFCDAMISIREEIRAIETGSMNQDDNLLKNAPHTAFSLLSSDWSHPYSRESAAYPDTYTQQSKFWPTVGRIDNAYGDRNLICSCVGMDNYNK
ncbi:MAG: aminomethyl-transferring glycine dehydrogenase [Cyanobacteria bacterium]|nr:aminomethyl-transferring glycine dehydrogenase [Cyanobacteria bacterium CG_2015-16_32_12]NCO79376.1 aminomethyl-transferring glycine dehydrogenase [Cyanobacteria bacterium CG_2015-22_32_23]NCQ05466.1 aminomethyl-transferring glycine dehydrogenase [Cyanobacteria bacterium CG_2015-09_32_10]NCQ41394.1 aminomethyl-transferring glycine dehydrogenase [Cyanobacteria bacterium CG_2015-04_32_10]NCS85650.1 aminomethyl-transferring glycine dehydrogenase [Cyanobacteria bacterium CG_2015-02_32_10]